MDPRRSTPLTSLVPLFPFFFFFLNFVLLKVPVSLLFYLCFEQTQWAEHTFPLNKPVLTVTH